MPEPFPIDLLDAALRGGLLALVGLLGAALWRERRSRAAALLGALLAGLAVQSVTALPWLERQAPQPWMAPLIGISVGNAVLFWLFARALFDDAFVPRLRHALIWATVVTLGIVFYAVVVIPQQRVLTLGPLAVAIAMRWIPVVFAVLAVVAAVSQWRADLVESRRRIRGAFVAAGSAYTLFTAFARLSSGDGRLSPLMACVDAGSLLLIAGVMANRIFVLKAGDALLLAPLAGVPVPGPGSGPEPASGPEGAGLPGRGPVPAPAGKAAAVGGTPPDASEASASETEWVLTKVAPSGPSVQRVAHAEAPADRSDPPDPADPSEARLAAALDRAMREERAYRTEDLTVAALAQRLGTPEYRLRRLINQRLGHRNFNAFVNGFRLAEAKRVLADPEAREVPILTVALDAGFQSIGPFNRAFKADTGLTPSEFRRRYLADS